MHTCTTARRFLSSVQIKDGPLSAQFVIMCWEGDRVTVTDECGGAHPAEYSQLGEILVS